MWLLIGAATLLTSPDARAQAQTYLVTTIDDTVDDTDGVLSLREAIQAANANDADGDRIEFDTALDGQTIMLAQGEMAIEDDVIVGDDLSSVSITIDAGSASRIFSINTGSATGAREVVFYALTLTNGAETNGGDTCDTW